MVEVGQLDLLGMEFFSLSMTKLSFYFFKLSCKKMNFLGPMVYGIAFCPVKVILWKKLLILKLILIDRSILIRIPNFLPLN